MTLPDWDPFWFSSFHSGMCQANTFINPKRPPVKSFPFHHSSLILPFRGVFPSHTDSIMNISQIIVLLFVLQCLREEVDSLKGEGRSGTAEACIH